MAVKKENPLKGAFRAPVPGEPPPAGPAEDKKPSEPPKAALDPKATGTIPVKADEGKKPADPPKDTPGTKATGDTPAKDGEGTGLGKTIDTVKLPAAAIKDIAAKAQNEEVGGLTVKLPEAEISFDTKALSAIQAQAGSQITLTVTPAKPADLNSRQKEAVGSAPVFDLTLRSSSGAITDFRGGYATVSLPYTLTAGQNPSGVVVYYLDSAGNITPCTTMYDVRSKSAIFTTGHLSLYFVGYVMFVAENIKRILYHLGEYPSEFGLLNCLGWFRACLKNKYCNCTRRV